MTRRRFVFAALVAVLLIAGAVARARITHVTTAATTGTLTDRLSPDHTAVEVTGTPTGTARIHVAYMQDLSGVGAHYVDVAASTVTYRPPAGYPVVDMLAQSSSGASLGTWAGRLQISAAPPPPPPPSMKVGLDSGGWWLSNDAVLSGGKLKLLRKQNGSSEYLSAQEAKGWQVIDLIGHNPATSQNFSALASEGLARIKAHPGIVATEALNEPQNPYLSGSESQGNVEAYARGINTMAAAYKAAGVSKPILWSVDGGYRGVPSWGAKVWPLLSPAARELGRPTVHPYGGTGERAQSARPHSRVEESFALTKRKGWVTEFGWPTCVGCANTGDSLQWTQAEQAANIESFILWAPPYEETVTYFQYRDYGPNNYYGIETSGGTHKSSFDVLERLAP